METLSVDPTRKYVSYDIVSMASATLMMVSIDRHTMYVYAIDGRYIEPMRVNVITVPIGSRYSVLLPLDQPAGTYNIRAVNSGINQILNGTAVLTYNTSHQSQQEAVSKPWIDIVGRDTSQSTVFFDEAKVIPFPIETPPVEVNNTYHLTISHVNSSYRWKMGNSSLMPSYQEDTPVLFNRSSISSDARISTTSGTWVDLIISVSGVAEPSHPIHKHSNKFYVIGQGYGPFEYSSVTEAMKASPQYFNFQTPQIRDTFGTLASPQGQSWLAIRYHVRNPGPFLLHCHAPEHEVGGMAVVVLDGIDAWPSLPAEYRVPNGSSVGVVGLKQERPK
jgi:FtsP/CotA-like multicopper oxidase with cupredoxin domain